MSIDEIVDHLTASGHRAALSSDRKKLVVTIDVADQTLILEHAVPERIERLPVFYLQNPPRLGTLAHIMPDADGALGKICVEDRDSVSVNYDVPTAVQEGITAITTNKFLVLLLIGVFYIFKPFFIILVS